jgi:Tfp pilus assembly protein PilP
MKTILYVLIIFLLFLSGGCKKEQVADKKPTAEKVQPAQTSEEKKVSQDITVGTETYQYDAKGRRDPFLSLVAKAKQKPVRKKGASPFESHEIEEMELLAIAWNKNKSYALIMLPDKKTYTITEGMTLGLQGGKVQKITKDAVHIREFVKDYRGDIKPRDAILKLHKGEE